MPKSPRIGYGLINEIQQRHKITAKNESPSKDVILLFLYWKNLMVNGNMKIQV